MTFIKWLLNTGYLDATELGELNKAYTERAYSNKASTVHYLDTAGLSELSEAYRSRHRRNDEVFTQYPDDIEREIPSDMYRRRNDGDITFTYFIARKIPQQFMAYQTYLRLTGADTTPHKE
jgi:hypothetical protein